MLLPRIGCYAVYECTEEGWENASNQFESICKELEDVGLEVVKAPEFVIDENSSKRVAKWFSDKDIDILHPLVITWSFDHLTHMIWQQVKVPVAVRSIPGIRTGSVVGCQQLGAVLAEMDIEHRIFYGSIDDYAVIERISVYARACALKNSLSSSKFAMLGRRTPGMTPVAFDELEILERFGARIITIGMDEFFQYTEGFCEEELDTEWKKIASKASAVKCSKADGIASIRNYLAMKKLINEQGLDGIAIGSYPECLGTACLAISLLNNEGIAAGCEGDMNSTIAMYLLNKLCGQPVHFGEMLELDEKKNTIISSHCGSAALSLASEEGYVLCPVRLANSGVCVRFKSHTGAVTYVNMLGRKDSYRLCAFEGNAIATDMVFEGNPMKIKLNTPIQNIWEDISSYGFSHHWMAVYAGVALTLKEFCNLTGVKGVFPDERYNDRYKGGL